MLKVKVRSLIVMVDNITYYNHTNLTVKCQMLNDLDVAVNILVLVCDRQNNGAGLNQLSEI
jgi:hypothetical protein